MLHISAIQIFLGKVMKYKVLFLEDMEKKIDQWIYFVHNMLQLICHHSMPQLSNFYRPEILKLLKHLFPCTLYFHILEYSSCKKFHHQTFVFYWLFLEHKIVFDK